MKALYAGERLDSVVTGGESRISKMLDYLENAGVELEYMQTEKSPKSFIKRSFLLTNIWYIWRFCLIQKNKSSILLEDYSKRFSLFLFNLFLAFTGKVRIVGIVGGFYFSYRKSYLKNWIDRVISRLFLKPMSLVFTSGQAAAWEIVRMRVPQNKIKVVYPALRSEFTQCSKRTQINKNPVQLLFIGRLHPVKGLEYLLEAVNILKKQEIKLLVVGDTNRYPWYTNQIFEKTKRLEIGDKVEFFGEIKCINKLIEIFQEVAIFVLPSLWDTSPIAVIEAMCVGLPIVATNVGGIPEWVEDGINGILVPPENSQSLADAILNLIRDPYLREKMSQKAYETSFQFRERTWEDVGKAYYEAIKSISDA